MAAYEAVRRKGRCRVRANLMFSPAWPNIQAEDVRDLLLDWGRWLGGRGMGDEYLRMAGFYTESDYSHENCLRAECGPYGLGRFQFRFRLAGRCHAGTRDRSGKERYPRRVIHRKHSRSVRDGQQTCADRRPALADRTYQDIREEIARIKDLGLVLQAYSNRWIHYEGERPARDPWCGRHDRILPMRDLLDAKFMLHWRPTMYRPTCSIPSGTWWHARPQVRRTSRHRASALSNGGPGTRPVKPRGLALKKMSKARSSPANTRTFTFISGRPSLPVPRRRYPEYRGPHDDGRARRP